MATQYKAEKKSSYVLLSNSQDLTVDVDDTASRNEADGHWAPCDGRRLCDAVDSRPKKI